jgi:hypothetical protein
MSYTPYQGRSKWRNFNREPRVLLRGDKINLTEHNANDIAKIVLKPVLQALGVTASRATLVLNLTGGDDREPVLELKRPEDEQRFPRQDVVVFVSRYNQ